MLYSLIESISLDKIVAPLPKEELVRVEKDSECANDVIVPREETIAAEEAEAIEVLAPKNTSTVPMVLCSAEELTADVVALGDVVDAPVAAEPSPEGSIQSLKKRKKRAILGGFWQLVAPDPNFLEAEEYDDCK
jgi:hypothetical protein